MRQFFQMDGPIFSGLSKLADLMILNILFLITCLPIVTIGAALTALSYATLKMKGPAEGYAWRNYLKSFKQNFRQATVIWLIMLVAAVILFMDYRITNISGGGIYMIVRYAAMVGALLWLMLLYYVFPMLSRFENTVKQTISNAFMLAVANLPKTILMFLTTGGLIALTMYNSYTVAYGILLWLVLGFALVSFINSTIQYKIFEKLIPEEVKAAREPNESWVMREDTEETQNQNEAQNR